jgi:hypothetical protein
MQQRRKEQRADSNLAVTLDAGSGVARNHSASGIYFETEVPLRAGASVSFSMDVVNPDGQSVRMFCAGWVIRTEQLEGRIGAGVRIDEFHVERPAGSE